MANVAANRAEEVIDLLNRYVRLLDDRRFDEWLALFTEDCYYTLILHEDYVKGNNMVAIGEDKARLAGRIEVGQNVERDLQLHLISAVIAEEGDRGTVEASANFAVIRGLKIHCCGRYVMTLVSENGGFKISKCTAVLNNDSIIGTIYLPV